MPWKIGLDGERAFVHHMASSVPGQTFGLDDPVAMMMAEVYVVHRETGYVGMLHQPGRDLPVLPPASMDDARQLELELARRASGSAPWRARARGSFTLRPADASESRSHWPLLSMESSGHND